MQYLTAFCGRLEAASDVNASSFVGPVVSDKCVKFHDSCLNRSGEILPEIVGCGIFHRFFHDNFRQEGVCDDISGVAVVGRYGCLYEIRLI